MLMWMNFICPLVCLLGLVFSVDEVKMGFKGKHKDKLQIAYKNEGDSFQVDALFQEGYTYQVYMRNDLANSTYLNPGLSPLHLQVMNLFYSVKDEHYHYAIDNMYNLTYFVKLDTTTRRNYYFMAGQ